MYKPKLSIIIPSFNQSLYLEETILSIIEQEYENYELIIVDGGSQDGTIDIIKKYENYIWYWISEADKGQSHAFNKGLAIATGDFIGWQNSDDLYMPNSFKSFSKYYEKFENNDVFYSNTYQIDENSKVINEIYSIPYSILYINYRDLVRNQSSFVRRTKMLEINGLDENLHFAMDYELYIKLSKVTNRFMYCDEFWGSVRRHADAKTCIDSNLARRYFEKDEVMRRYNLYNKYFIKKVVTCFIFFKFNLNKPSRLKNKILKNKFL